MVRGRCRLAMTEKSFDLLVLLVCAKDFLHDLVLVLVRNDWLLVCSHSVRAKSNLLLLWVIVGCMGGWGLIMHSRVVELVECSSLVTLFLVFDVLGRGRKPWLFQKPRQECWLVALVPVLLAKKANWAWISVKNLPVLKVLPVLSDLVGLETLFLQRCRYTSFMCFHSFIYCAMRDEWVE